MIETVTQVIGSIRYINKLNHWPNVPTATFDSPLWAGDHTDEPPRHQLNKS